MPNYVKFQRGSKAAFAAQKAINGLSQDTLYFVYDKEDTAGSLYLGGKLISNVGEGTGVTSLSKLNDVLINGTPAASDILIFDSDGKWKNIPLSEVADIIAAEDGLGFTVNENIFLFETPAGHSIPVLNLSGFESADSGMFAMKGTNGKLSWGKPDISTLEGKVGDLAEQFESIKRQISEASHLTYKKINSLEEATEENTVYLLLSDADSEDNKYEEYMFVNGVLEKLGNWGVNLTDYATTEQLQGVNSTVLEVKGAVETLQTSVGNLEAAVGDITNLFGYTEENPVTIIQQLNEINERLTWQEIAMP